MEKRCVGFFDTIFSVGSWRLKCIKLLDYLLGSLIARFFQCPHFAGKSDQPLAKQTIRKVLIIRPGGIGDAVFLLPFIRLIKQNSPSIVIDILCEQRNHAVFSSQADLFGGIYWYEYLATYPMLRKKVYDVVIDTEQWHYLSALTSHWVKPAFNVGFDSRIYRKKFFTHAVPYEDNGHELENFRSLFCTVFPFCVSITDLKGAFHVDPRTLNWVASLLPVRPVALFLGASIILRRLTRDQNLEIIRFLLSKNIPVALLGGQDVIDMARELTREISNPLLTDFVGKTSFLESAALIKHSRLFIGADSGIMHLACAVLTPLIGIFGPGNVRKWTPRGSDDFVVSRNLPCSPCTHFGYTIPTCGGRYPCIKEIEMKVVFKRMDEILSCEQ